MRADELDDTEGSVYRNEQNRVLIFQGDRFVSIFNPDGSADHAFLEVFKKLEGDWHRLVPQPVLGEAVPIKELAPFAPYLLDIGNGVWIVAISDFKDGFRQFAISGLADKSGGTTGLGINNNSIRAIYPFDPAWLPAAPPVEKSLREKIVDKLRSMGDWRSRSETDLATDLAALLGEPR